MESFVYFPNLPLPRNQQRIWKVQAHDFSEILNPIRQILSTVLVEIFRHFTRNIIDLLALLPSNNESEFLFVLFVFFCDQYFYWLSYGKGMWFILNIRSQLTW